MKEYISRFLSLIVLFTMVSGSLNIASLATSGNPDGARAANPENGPGTGPRAVYTIAQTTVGDWKSGTPSNLTVFNESGGELRLSGLEYIDAAAFPVLRVRDLATDSGGNLYIATQLGGVVKICKGSDVVTDLGRAVPDEDNTLCLAMDRNDTLWGAGRSFAGTSPNRGGIVWRMNTTDLRFDAVGKADPANNAVWAICCDPNGTVWAGTMSGVVASFDPSTGAVTKLNSGNPLIPGSGIFQLSAASNGIVYAGTTNSGGGGRIIRIDPSTGAFQTLNSNNPVVWGDGIMAMTAGSDGNVYGGTVGNGGDVFVINATSDQISILGKPVSGCGAIGDLSPAPDGSIYGTAGAGSLADFHLFKLDTGTGAFVDVAVPFPGSGWPGPLTVASDGTVWGSGQNQMLYRLAPEYQKHPAARLDRLSTGRIFTENFEMSDINWDTGPSGANAVSFSRVIDPTRPVPDGTVYEETADSAAAYTKAGSFGNSPDAFPGAPASVMEASFKLNSAGSQTPCGVRLFMDWNNNNEHYSIIFFEDRDQIILMRDNNQIGPAYSGMSIDPGVWYNVKWKVWQPANGAGPNGGISVWVNDTKIFDEIPIFPPYRLSGSVVLGTRFYDASFDNVRLYKDTNITVGGLQLNQNVALYAANGTLVANALSAGASAVLNVNETSFPLAGYFNITDTDGVTVIYNSPVLADIFGGDAYTLDLSPLGSSWKYFPDGTFLSQPLDAGWSVHWRGINWTALVPAGTTLGIRTRTAPTVAELPSAQWSPVYGANPGQIASPDNRWLQFEAVFTTAAPAFSPDLLDVTVQYESFPNFTIALSQSADIVYPNDTITYTVRCDQTGNGIARDVWITDVLPLWLSFVNSSDEANRTGSVWHLSLLAPSWSYVLEIQAKVDGLVIDNATITNTASINFTDSDGTALGNYSSSVTARVLNAFFSVDFSGPSVAGPGDLIQYSLWYNKSGSAGIPNLSIGWNISDGPSIVNSTSESARQGTNWRFTDVEGSNYLGITARIDPSTPDGAVVWAWLAFNALLPNGSPAGSSFIMPVWTNISAPVINAVKSVDSETARPGDTLNYTISFNNTGSAPAENLTVTDILAPELEYIASVPPWNGTGHSWSFPDVPVNTSGQVLITARVRNETAEGAVILNRATIGFSTASGFELPVKTTNEVNTSIGAPRAPNMTVAMQADKTVVGWNDTVNFSVGYDNTGDGPALYAVLAAELPSGMTLVTSSAEPSRAGTSWILQSVPAGPHGLTFTVMIGSGIANNTVLAAKITLNYTDPRAGPRPSSQASVSVTVISAEVLPPITKPTIIYREPGPGATDVPADTTIVVTFSSPMNRSTIEGAFSVSPAVQGSFNWTGNTLVFTPAKKLESGKRYTISVTTGVRDEGGNPLDQDYSWTFTTRTKATSATESMPWTLIIILLVCIIALACLAALALLRKGGGRSTERAGAPPSVAAAPAQPLPGSDGTSRTGGQTYSKPDKDIYPPMPTEEKAEPPKAALAAPVPLAQVQWGEETKPDAPKKVEGGSGPSRLEDIPPPAEAGGVSRISPFPIPPGAEAPGVLAKSVTAQEPSSPVHANPEKKAIPDADIEALMNRLKRD